MGKQLRIGRQVETNIQRAGHRWGNNCELEDKWRQTSKEPDTDGETTWNNYEMGDKWRQTSKEPDTDGETTMNWETSGHKHPKSRTQMGKQRWIGRQVDTNIQRAGHRWGNNNEFGDKWRQISKEPDTDGETTMNWETSGHKHPKSRTQMGKQLWIGRQVNTNIQRAGHRGKQLWIGRQVKTNIQRAGHRWGINYELGDKWTQTSKEPDTDGETTMNWETSGDKHPKSRTQMGKQLWIGRQVDTNIQRARHRWGNNYELGDKWTQTSKEPDTDGETTMNWETSGHKHPKSRTQMGKQQWIGRQVDTNIQRAGHRWGNNNELGDKWTQTSKEPDTDGETTMNWETSEDRHPKSRTQMGKQLWIGRQVETNIQRAGHRWGNNYELGDKWRQTSKEPDTTSQTGKERDLERREPDTTRHTSLERHPESGAPLAHWQERHPTTDNLRETCHERHLESRTLLRTQRRIRSSPRSLVLESFP